MKKLMNNHICRILCRNITIFCRQELASLFQVQQKLKACRSLKLKFSSSSFLADDSHVKSVWLHVVVFSEHVLHFWDNVHLFKHYSVKVPRNCFNSFSYWDQTRIWRRTLGSDDLIIFKCFRVYFLLKKKTIQFPLSFSLYLLQKRALKLSICQLPTKRSAWVFDITNRTNVFSSFQSYYKVVMYLFNSLAKSCTLFWKYS